MSKAWDKAVEGMQAASDHVGRVDPWWKEQARQGIYDSARRCKLVFIDDIHDQLNAMGIGVPTRSHGCALGALMNEAHKNGVIEPTGMKRRSSRSASHADLRPVWRSLIFDPNEPLIPLVDLKGPRMCSKCGGTRWVKDGICNVCRLEDEMKKKELEK